jgi:hypothetical protein
MGCADHLLRLVDPYQAPTLYVRRPGDDHEERHIYTVSVPRQTPSRLSVC